MLSLFFAVLDRFTSPSPKMSADNLYEIDDTRLDERLAREFDSYPDFLSTTPSNVLTEEKHEVPMPVLDIDIPVPMIAAPPVISRGFRKTTLLTTTNSVFLDLTENLLASISNCGVSPDITIVAEDEVAYESLKRRKDVRVWRTRFENYPEELVKNSPPFKTLVNQRYAYVKEFLDNGTSVLFSDADMVWLANPFRYFRGRYDIYVAEDIIRDKKTPDPFYTAGFVFYRATNRTRAFVDKLIKWIEIDGGKAADQKMLNGIIARQIIPDLKVKVLSSDVFPHGKLYFNYKWRVLRNSPVVIHNNYIAGHDMKVKRLKAMGLWYLKEEDKVIK